MVGVLLSILSTSLAQAADRWVLEFDATGPPSFQGCPTLWTDAVIFHNGSSAVATVTLLGVSNGGVPQGVDASFDVVPGETTFLAAKVGGETWRPSEADVWVVHVDVPEGLSIESHGELGLIGSCAPTGVPTPPERGFFGRFTLPVFSSLVPTGKPQIFLDPDLVNDGHVNVGVYNAAEVPAEAKIEVHETCDDAIIDSRTVHIAANTLIQYTGFQLLGTCEIAGVPYRTFYVKVVVDQPSLAYLTEVSNQAPVPIPVGVSLGQ
jgi:hypothetical protein